MPGTWTTLKNKPGLYASTMLLLTDGAVMCQEEGGLNWKKLTPDQTGDYINGTWTSLAPAHNTRRYYASAVLRDGRVFVSGGEYSDAGGWTNKTEIYDPALDTWTQINPPTGWANVGDAPCAVLPDGRVLLGSYNTVKTALADHYAKYGSLTSSNGCAVMMASAKISKTTPCKVERSALLSHFLAPCRGRDEQS
jgi:hypothetical protein